MTELTDPLDPPDQQDQQDQPDQREQLDQQDILVQPDLKDHQEIAALRHQHTQHTHIDKSSLREVLNFNIG